ncbi:mitochondrial 54S ribosomal protein YmL16 [Sugiyamaella lignohabitans]|uniref:Mitochondrial 54S ribosomal protein YmL16 n=1 Tax=Sugiyamaella lignohabitans TaxID=796027 RepID=A0A161HNM0_9ASCO|nr:mitochondrial 54S ribosomal protein YmL16 [Sugiyamaella lignohabitans]ANB15757.1 mitochondrial 54S ribosomal protein YmL16 [Sugiyamaella lignohabitans]
MSVYRSLTPILRLFVNSPSKANALPSLSRSFSACSMNLSNIGNMPIVLPEGVKLSVEPKKIDDVSLFRMKLEDQRGGKPKIHITKTATITGPNGTVKVDLADFVQVEPSAESSEKIHVSVVNSDKRHQKQMWGTSRSLISNGVVGVSEGHLSIVKFVGTGFRAILEKTKEGREQLSLRVGYCVPIVIKIPKDIKVTVPLPHRLIIEGVDKQRVKQLAAKIRKHRPPEPYKGKGIFVDGETIKLKQRKIK